MIQKLMNKKKNKKGFTLIELIVVIAILAILALILVPTISNYVSEANDARDLANVRSVYSQLNADVAMTDFSDDATDGDVAVLSAEWGFTASSAGSNSGTGNGGTKVPEGMTITFTVENGALTVFDAEVSGNPFHNNTAGEIVKGSRTPVTP